MTEFCGTEGYIAPEVYTGSYNYKCDLWSLGAMVHEMLTGHLPVDPDDESFEEQRWSFNLNETTVKRLSMNCRLFLEKCLQTKPAKRGSAVLLLKTCPWIKTHYDNDICINKKEAILNRMATFSD